MSPKTDGKYLLLIIVAYLVVQLLTFRTGTGYEDFRDVQLFKQTTTGLVPYEDIMQEYGIAGLYFWPLLTKLFGSELIILRLFVILMGVIGIWFIYDISKRIMTRGFSLIAAFCGVSLFFFPTNSYTHYLSILSIVIAVWYACKFFYDKKRLNLFMWGVLLTLTFHTRHIPAGIALIIASLFSVIIYSFQDNRRFAILKNIFLLFLPFIIIAVIFYFVTKGKYTLMLIPRYALMFTPSYRMSTVTLKLPNIISLISNFVYASRTFNFADINTIYKVITFFNLISGHIVYWFVFILPTLYFIIIFAKSIMKEKLKKLSSENCLVIFLCSLNFLLCLYFHNILLKLNWPDIDGGGLLWLQAAQYLLQPGIIVSIYLLYKLQKRIQKPFLTTIISATLIFSIVFVPKVYALRYIFKNMPLGWIAGIKGIYMDSFCEKTVVPAVEYINNNSNIPEYIFVIGYYPGFYALTNKKPLIPEFIGITYILDPNYLKDENRKFLFPGRENKLLSLSKDDLNNIILNRLKTKRPCVIHVYGDLSKDNPKWIHFFKNNYHPVKTFTYERIIKGTTNDNPSVTIYLPNSRL